MEKPVPFRTAVSYALEFETPDVFVVGQPAPLAAYRVVARTAEPQIYFESVTVDTYSIDNLCPPTPDAWIVEGTDYRFVLWTLPDIPDLGEMCVYRSDESEAYPDSPIDCPGEPIYVEYHLSWYYYRVQFNDIHGNLSEYSEELHGQFPNTVPDQVPTVLALGPIAPNPFNPRTTIHYAVPTSSLVDLTIFDIQGRQIASLVGEVKSAGRYEVIWSGVDSGGRQVPTGTYFCRLMASGETQTVKMVLIR